LFLQYLDAAFVAGELQFMAILSGGGSGGRLA
jgi:hypothetical protein